MISEGALCEINQSLVVTTTTTTTTAIAPVAVCPSNINVCQNFGSCLVNLSLYFISNI
jgi:hypothetical protein